MPQRLLTPLICGLTLLAGPVLAELLAIDWDADGRFRRELAVAPGRFAEACGRLPARAAVHWSFEAGAALDFNIHYHEGQRVEFPARLDGSTRADGRLLARFEQDYCWMWTNRSDREARLTLELRRE